MARNKVGTASCRLMVMTVAKASGRRTSKWKKQILGSPLHSSHPPLLKSQKVLTGIMKLAHEHGCRELQLHNA